MIQSNPLPSQSVPQSLGISPAGQAGNIQQNAKCLHKNIDTHDQNQCINSSKIKCITHGKHIEYWPKHRLNS